MVKKGKKIGFWKNIEKNYSPTANVKFGILLILVLMLFAFNSPIDSGLPLWIEIIGYVIMIILVLGLAIPFMVISEYYYTKLIFPKKRFSKKYIRWKKLAWYMLIAWAIFVYLIIFIGEKFLSNIYL